MKYFCLAVSVLLFAAFTPDHVEARDDSVAKSSRRPTLVEEFTLSEDLEWVSDIRWMDDSHIFVSAYRKGVFKVPLEEASTRSALVIPRGNGAKDIWLPMKFGVSGDLLAVGAPVFAYGWMKISNASLSELHSMAAVGDLDLFGDKILLLGAQRDEEQQFAPDGAIAWIGKLSQPPEALHPIFYSASGPGARSFDACALMDVSSARFMPDGSFVIVPGVEPDVYHYDPDGKLLATWSSENVGFNGECDLSDDEMYRLSVDEPGRWAWVNQRRIVDEILPLSNGPGLLVRTVRGEETTWELKLLRPGGKVETRKVPFTATSNLAHFKGDVRGDRIVLLLYFYGYTQQTRHPPQHPRLLELHYTP